MLQLALDSAAFYGLDDAAANEILARVRTVLDTWREKASRLDLSRADIALLEPVLDDA